MCATLHPVPPVDVEHAFIRSHLQPYKHQMIVGFSYHSMRFDSCLGPTCIISMKSIDCSISYINGTYTFPTFDL